MSDSPVTRTVVVVNTEGLHARPADMLARTALKFRSQIHVICRNERVDAKSTLNLLVLGATRGTQLVIEASGEDATEAVDTLATMIAGGFAEENKSPGAGPANDGNTHQASHGGAETIHND